MPANGGQVLCVGSEPSLLEVRRAVLEREGYKARTATLEEAETLLPVEPFDLLILSATVTDEEKHRICLKAGDTPALRLRGVTFPNDLLHQVQAIIARDPKRRRPVSSASALRADPP